MSKYDRVMKKCYKFYQNPKVEELYNVDCTITDFLIPRLEKFLDKSTEIVNWDWHKQEQGVDIPGTLRIIIRELKYIQEHSFDFDVKISKRCQNYAEDAFKRLGEIYFYLWY